MSEQSLMAVTISSELVTSVGFYIKYILYFLVIL